MTGVNMYEKTNPIKLFFSIAIPGAISMIASYMWGLFDGIFVGNLLGQNAFAALNLAFPFVLINFALADLIGVGSSINISILLGQKEHGKANNLFTCACILIVLTAILSGTIIYIGAPILMELLGADDELAKLAIRYIRVYAIASPFTTMTFAADNFLRICGKIKSSMSLNILMSILILVLEYICLAVLKLGIAGSALAVSTGMFICTLIALYPFVRKKLILQFCKPQFSFSIIKKVIINGSPNFLSNIASRLTEILMNIVLLKVGGAVAVSVYGILMYAGDLIHQLLYGTCDGMQPAIGYNWGAGNVDRVKKLFRCSTIACAVIAKTGTIVLQKYPDLIVSLFTQSKDKQLLEIASYALKIYSFTFVTRWIGFAIQSLMVALEKSAWATILSLSNAIIFPLLLLPTLWSLKLNGLWMNAPITSAIVGVLAIVLYTRLRLTKGERL